MMEKTIIEFTVCHRKPNRSFFWRGKQFPVCARCTGIYIGYLSFPLFTFCILNLSLIWSIAFMIPTVIDGLMQAFLNRESNNKVRFVTGLFAGAGAMSLVAIVGQFMGNQLLLLIKS